MTEYLNHPLVRGAIAGVVVAAWVDIAAFRAWKSYSDVWSYDWKIASFRWLQGAVAGMLAAAGLEQVV